METTYVRGYRKNLGELGDPVPGRTVWYLQLSLQEVRVPKLNR